MAVLTRDGRHEVAPRPVDVARASPAEATAALSAFVAGVRARDAAALASLAPAGRPASEDLLAGIAANAASLDLRAVTARYVDQVGVVGDDGSWSGVAEVTWRLGGLEVQAARTDVAVTFAPDADGLGIVGFGTAAAPATRVPLWLRGRLAVSRAPGVLVMVDGDRDVAEAFVDRAVRGVDVVRRVLARFRGPVVVEVPATAADLDASLGVPPGTYSGIAAVTASAGSTAEDDAPTHVFVNPEVTAGLRRAGAQVVMTHELVHVATDAVRSPVEPWLREGFADYVALRDTRLPDRTALGRAIEAARRDGVPKALPTAADLNTRAADLQARYEEAWLACRVIAERLGERKLLEVYRAARRGVSSAWSLQRAGLAPDTLIRAWQARLRRYVS